MIVQIGMALALVLAAVLFGLQGSDIATGMISEVMAPFLTVAQSGMVMLAHLAPILIAALPLYWLSRKKGENQPLVLTWGAVYGIILFGLIQVTGIDLRMIQAVQQSWSGSVISTFGAITQFMWGILTVATYYLAGIILAILSVVLEVVSGIGSLADSGKRHVTTAQAGILDRILRRLTE